MKILSGFRTLSIIMFIGLIVVQCKTIKKEDTSKYNGLEMAKLMANSEIAHFPNPSTVDFNPKGKWNYTGGLIAQSMIALWNETGNPDYFDYAKTYADDFIDEIGVIRGYNRNDFNIDKINSGKFLFDLYNATGDERYKIAIDTLRSQLTDHPRTSEGGFWHKKRYTNQMWLDGLYMGTPFFARYADEFNEPDDFADVINQFIVVHKHTYNSIVGLNYHGWEESREQKWANPETGCSPNFWGRAEGWYAMALVDVLDFIPANYPKRDTLITILNEVATGIKKYQDKKSGLWYQVLDKGDEKGNYLEASASNMFVYTILKAARKGYIDSSYVQVAEKGYRGIRKNFIHSNDDGTIDLTNVCAVAGLGGKPYRDGTYQYYINEPVRDNDPKGVGTFILASLEMNNYIKPN